MNEHIGYVPQFSTLQSHFPASVLDMVMMGAARFSARGGHWHTGGGRRKTALEYLETLGLADCAGHPLSALSGGQRQRALVARALMGRPDNQESEPPPFLLLLDEPTASIDPEGTFCFYEFLGKLRGSISLIIVSHDLFVVSPFFDTIAAVNKGLTRLRDSELTTENLTALFGRHLHQCPVADLQHAGKALHQSGCTHPACAGQEPCNSQETHAPPAAGFGQSRDGAPFPAPDSGQSRNGTPVPAPGNGQNPDGEQKAQYAAGTDEALQDPPDPARNP